MYFASFTYLHIVFAIHFVYRQQLPVGTSMVHGSDFHHGLFFTDAVQLKLVDSGHAQFFSASWKFTVQLSATQACYLSLRFSVQLTQLSFE